LTIVTIRDAADEDSGALGEVFRRASLSNADDRPALLEHPEFLHYVMPSRRGARCRVAVEVADVPRVIGFATTVPRPDGGLELEDLFVDPDRMRQGVGQALIEDAVAFARAAGVDRIEVDGNPHARRFYEAVGFRFQSTVATELGRADRLHLAI
jgi:GNAT superfamily N-acetyltransferase